MQTIKPEHIKELKERYGNHANVAEQLGISPRHYARVRKGQYVTPTIAKLVQRLVNDKEAA